MSKRILVLDDQVRYGRSLQRALSPDYEIVVAGTVDDAIRQTDPAINAVLCDIRLDERESSNRDGLKYISWANERHPDMVVVAMSALDDSDVERDAIAAGARVFVRKPIVLTKLRELLDAITNVSA